MDQIGVALGSSFASHVADLCPYILKVIQYDRTYEKSLTLAVINFY